ncbi:MAG: Crp/Fnr family transcriptional regulator [Gracilibacteraceae bacterium]|jgi:CRP-like cAMP-binding protein|nr:Crp/Fnr family transcriptional regulator [Gracilibacteraceae bacterium]
MMDNAEFRQVICPSFRTTLDNETMNVLFADCRALRVKKGESLYSQGERPQDIYWLQKGKVETYVTNARGRKKTICYYLPHSYIGVISALNEKDDITTVEAKELSQVLVCPSYTFFDRARRHGAMETLYKDMCMLCSLLAHQVAMLSLYTAKEKISCLQSDSLTQQQIGDFIGSTQVHVARTIKQMKDAENFPSRKVRNLS